MFNPAHVTTLLPARSRAQALESWREGGIVRTRRRGVVDSESASRAWALASRVAALDGDAEAAAAPSPSAVAA